MINPKKSAFWVFGVFIIFSSCTAIKTVIEEKIPTDFSDNFNNLKKFNEIWEDASHGNVPKSYFLNKGKLVINTRPETSDRVKIKTRKSNFGVGSYIWKIYVPTFNLYDQCGIGAFLYNDNLHEFDFEIGSGNQEVRNRLNAKPTDVVLYCTSQGYPYSSDQYLIESEQWYELQLKVIKGKNDNYLIEWFVNSKLIKSLQTDYSSEVTFGIYSSLENLKFIGDQLTSSENQVFFEKFEFTNLTEEVPLNRLEESKWIHQY